MLQRFVHHPIPTSFARVSTVVGMTYHNPHRSTILCLTEVGEQATEEVVAKHLRCCDIVCLVYDVTERSSFAYVREVLKRLPAGCKVLLVVTKKDLLVEVGVRGGRE